MKSTVNELMNRLAEAGISEDLINEIESMIQVEKQRGDKYKKLYEDKLSYESWTRSAELAKARGADHL